MLPLQAGQAQSQESSSSPATQIPMQPSKPAALSPFSGKSPHGQLQLLENMFQALPQRHAKRPHQSHAAPAAASTDHHAVLTQSSSLSQACMGPSHCNSDSHQPHAESMALREALGKPQGATQEGDFLVKQPDGGTTPHNHHAFRLSFSPTGIPTVEPDRHLGSQAPLLELPQHQGSKAALVEPDQGPQARPREPDHHLCTQAASLAPDSVTHNLACPASGTASEVCQSSGSTAGPIAKPKAIAGTTAPGGLCRFGAASVECSITGKGGDGRDPMVQAEARQLQQQLSKPLPAGADSFRHQAVSTESEVEAQVEDVAVATGSPAQLELPHAAQASTPAIQPAAQSAAESAPLTADTVTQAMLEAHTQASVPVAGDVEGRLQSCTPGGAPCPGGLPSPSTPMLAWLDALGTPGTTLLSDVFKPSRCGKGVDSAREEHAPPGSAAHALMDESTPGRLAASPEAPPEAVLHAVLSPVVPAKACTDTPPLSSSSLPLLTDALSGTASSVPRPVPDEATPGPLPHQAEPGPWPDQEVPEPDQAMPGQLPHQATPVPASNPSRNNVPATPHGWSRRAAPPMGPPTGLSGLTTPASAAEMHR